MTSVAINQRLTKVQNKLFEHAHSEPLELKPLAIKFSKQGLVGEKLYTNPRLIALPLGVDSSLASLNARQISLISAATFALIYRYVACSEDLILNSNMVIAEKVFDRYSDDYMVLYQETEEEYDHIWSFRTIYTTVCRELGVNKNFHEPGFFRGEVGGTPTNKLLDWQYRLLQFITGDGVRLMSPKLVRQSGVGAMWLLYRFVANVQLKQTESYLFDDPEKFDYNPLAREITQAHATDEARHYTTSLDIGLDLYQAASSQGKHWVRYMLKTVVESYIRYYFLNYWEMLDLYLKGIKIPAIVHGLESLRMASHHPDFAELSVDPENLLRTWHQLEIGKTTGTMGSVKRKRWHYTAQQLERLIKALDLELNTQSLGETYQRYQEALSLVA